MKTNRTEIYTHAHKREVDQFITKHYEHLTSYCAKMLRTKDLEHLDDAEFISRLYTDVLLPKAFIEPGYIRDDELLVKCKVWLKGYATEIHKRQRRLPHDDIEDYKDKLEDRTLVDPDSSLTAQLLEQVVQSQITSEYEYRLWLIAQGDITATAVAKEYDLGLSTVTGHRDDLLANIRAEALRRGFV